VRKALGVVAVAVVLGIGVLLATQRFSDGPPGLGPLSGGPLRSGPLVTDASAEWPPPLESGRAIELQLVEPPTSRLTGALVHEGQLYVPCDLGFLYRRSPGAAFRFIGGLIRAAKHWHEEAERDGRVVLRIAGKRYERKAVRVIDPELLATLRAIAEQRAGKYFGGDLLPVAGDPEAIWFFRIDPRPS
jgi:hypothetical protein